MLEAREQPVDLGKSFLCISRIGIGAHFQILLHGHLQEAAPPLRHVRHAARNQPEGFRMRDVRVHEADTAGLRVEHPRHGLERGGFAGAVRADQRHNLARLDLQRHVLERVYLAVVHVDLIYLQHHAGSPPSFFLPRYASTTFWSETICSGDPLAMMRP